MGFNCVLEITGNGDRVTLATVTFEQARDDQPREAQVRLIAGQFGITIVNKGQNFFRGEAFAGRSDFNDARHQAIQYGSRTSVFIC